MESGLCPAPRTMGRRPLAAGAVFAFCLCAMAGPIFAEDEPSGVEFTENWFVQHELDMTQDLAQEIERQNSASVARSVVDRLASATRASTGPAAFDVSGGGGTAVTRSRMCCRSDANGFMSCVVHPVN